MKASLLAQFKEGKISITMFDEPQHHVYSMLKNDWYPKYISHRANIAESIINKFNPSAGSWVYEERKKNNITVVLFLKLSNNVFDKCFVQEWDKLVDEIEKEGGKVYAITSAPQLFAESVRATWDLRMEAIGDELNKLAKSQDILITPHPNFTYGRVHTSLIVNTPRKQLYKWTQMEGNKTQLFPDPLDVWRFTKMKIQNQSDTYTIKMGCPLTRVGWSEEHNNYKIYRAPLTVKGLDVDRSEGLLDILHGAL
eukprot:TRINITY_DN1936_c0_g1_i4.p2 TRINITY_DN1936_c0_g1~~TRINITY_DN1936_c0_g1_i4.p2  ORF type:complete len:253 (-),score=30.57 TRINITY_DN1936_c0_g1_i4:66-824(-)